jgi:hypothetical protein
MLSWTADNATTLCVVLGLVTLALAAVWWRTRKRPVAVAAGVGLALCVLVWVLGQVVVTDRKKLVASVREMTDHVNAGRFDEAANYFADEFEVDAAGHIIKDRKSLMDAARIRMKYAGIKRFVVWDIEVTQLERPKAVVTFYVRPEDADQFGVCHAEYILVGEKDWRIRKMDVKLPGGKTIPMFPFGG